MLAVFMLPVGAIVYLVAFAVLWETTRLRPDERFLVVSGAPRNPNPCAAGGRSHLSAQSLETERENRRSFDRRLRPGIVNVQ